MIEGFTPHCEHFYCFPFCLALDWLSALATMPTTSVHFATSLLSERWCLLAWLWGILLGMEGWSWEDEWEVWDGRGLWIHDESRMEMARNQQDGRRKGFGFEGEGGLPEVFQGRERTWKHDTNTLAARRTGRKGGFEPFAHPSNHDVSDKGIDVHAYRARSRTEPLD